MVKPHAVIYVDKDLLISLVNDESSCVVVQEENYHLALHPFHLTNITSSIRDILGEGVAKYNKKLSGILLGYENIKLLSQGTIVDDSFFVHLDISANFYLFKPEVGKVLTGVVSKKSVDHVGCLLYTIFNVAIPKPPETDNHEWIGDTVDIGDEVPFRITFLRIDTRLPYIRGEFVSQNNVHGEIGEQTKKHKKKSKRKISETIDDNDAENQPRKKIKRHKKNFDLSDEEVHDLNSMTKCQDDTNSNIETKTTQKKSKKLHKDSHYSLDETLNNVAIENSIKKKKKKHKKDSSAERLNETHNVFLDDSIMRKIKKEIHHEDSSAELLTETFDDLQDDARQKGKIKREQFNGDFVDGFTEKKKKKKKKKKQNDDDSWETMDDSLNGSFTDNSVRKKIKMEVHTENEDTFEVSVSKLKKHKHKKHKNIIT
ncbi:hypothetical protein FQA39_LY16392 [Lamprigera yunnana]|nr:hypothetical protein FQA39_LY16392 [Lamprigera yunnana]